MFQAVTRCITCQWVMFGLLNTKNKRLGKSAIRFSLIRITREVKKKTGCVVYSIQIMITATFLEERFRHLLLICFVMFVCFYSHCTCFKDVILLFFVINKITLSRKFICINLTCLFSPVDLGHCIFVTSLP